MNAPNALTSHQSKPLDIAAGLSTAGPSRNGTSELSFDNVVEATSDNGVLVAAGLRCPDEGEPFMLIGARGLTGHAAWASCSSP